MLPAAGGADAEREHGDPKYKNASAKSQVARFDALGRCRRILVDLEALADRGKMGIHRGVHEVFVLEREFSVLLKSGRVGSERLPPMRHIQPSPARTRDRQLVRSHG